MRAHLLELAGAGDEAVVEFRAAAARTANRREQHYVTTRAARVANERPGRARMHGRANDANADGSGNLVTGTLNMVAAAGAAWWFSAVDGWRLLDDDIGNTNGPVVIDVDGESTLVLGDTPAGVSYAYPYDGATATIGVHGRFESRFRLAGASRG